MGTLCLAFNISGNSRIVKIKDWAQRGCESVSKNVLMKLSVKKDEPKYISYDTKVSSLLKTAFSSIHGTGQSQVKSSMEYAPTGHREKSQPDPIPGKYGNQWSS